MRSVDVDMAAELDWMNQIQLAKWITYNRFVNINDELLNYSIC